MSQCFMIVVCKEELYWWFQKGCDPQQEAQLLVLNPGDCLVYSLMTWVVGQGCTFKLAGRTKLGRLAGAAESSVAIQKDLDLITS